MVLQSNLGLHPGLTLTSVPSIRMISSTPKNLSRAERFAQRKAFLILLLIKPDTEARNSEAMFSTTVNALSLTMFLCTHLQLISEPVFILYKLCAPAKV